MPYLKIRCFAAALAVAIFIYADALAQQNSDVLPDSSFEITGQVRLLVGSGTVERADIRLEGFGGNLLEQTQTDSRGRFRFTRLRRGQYLVTVRTPGYREEKQQVTVSQFFRRAQIFFDLKPDNSEPHKRPSFSNTVIDAKVPLEAQNEFEKGRARLAEEKDREALSHFERAVSIYPDFAEAHLLISETHMKMKAWDKAEKALTRVLKIKPQMTEALINLGEVYRREKRYPEAEKTLKELLKLDDKSWQGHFTMARVYWETNDLVKAGEQTAKTLQIAPEYAEAHLLGANIFMRAGLPQNALIEYEEYLRLAPKGEFAEQTLSIVQKLKKALAEKKK